LLAYILKRIAYIFFILWLISVLVFTITQILPGNVAKMILDQYATEESLRALEAKLGLNDPLPTQYFRWAGSIARGNLGVSLTMDRPIAPILFIALQRSSVLAIFSFLSVAIIGISLGVLAAVRRNSVMDHAVSIFSYLGISTPEFFWGIVLILFFGRYLGLLPASGYVSFTESPIQWFTHLILPVATLTFTLLAHISRLTRSGMLEVLESNYIRVARAKGLPRRMILCKHALRNALLPTITTLAIDFGWLIGGIVVVEAVFAYPGFGRLILFGVQRHDLPLIQASIITVAMIYCLMNLIADVVYTYLDPRIRYGKSEE
jgi:peptide/nickel transport system permease protein